jgi:hypothetical protein
MAGAGEDDLIPSNAGRLAGGAAEVDNVFLLLIRGVGGLEGDTCLKAEPAAPDPVGWYGVWLIRSKGGNSCRADDGDGGSAG